MSSSLSAIRILDRGLIMKRGVVSVIFALLLLAAAVSAVEFSATLTGDNIVKIGGTVEFVLRITNNDFKMRTLQVMPEPYASLPSSAIEVFSADPQLVEVNSGETKDVKLTIRMKDTVLPNDNYGSYVTIRDIKDGSKLDHNLIMKIIPPDDVVSVSTSIPKSVAPGNEFSVDVKFKNNMNLQLSNVDVYVGSELFEEKKTMIMFPLQRREESFKFKIPSMAKPKDYTFSVRVYHEGVMNGKFSDTFTVLQNSDVKQDVSVERGFLTETTTVTKTNNGNFVATEYFDYPASFFTRMFVSSSVDRTSEDSGGLHWIFDINPGQSVVLEVERSYVPLLVVFAVIALFVAVAYYLLTRGLVVRKKVFKLRKSAGVAQFTVMLHIKNRTRGSVKDMTIFEIVPSLIQPSTHFGTLKPDTMQKGEKGMKFIWKIPELSKGEERILSYQVDSKITVLGRIALPPCMIRFKNRSGRIVNVMSNPVSLELGMEKQ